MAAAVAGVFARPATARATPRTSAAGPAGAQARASEEDGDAAAVLETLRAARKAQRRKKKERRRAKKASGKLPPQNENAGTPDAGGLALQPLETRVDSLDTCTLGTGTLEDGSQITPRSQRAMRRLMGLETDTDDDGSVASAQSHRPMLADGGHVKRLRPDVDFAMAPPPARQRRRAGDGSGGGVPSTPSGSATKRQ